MHPWKKGKINFKSQKDKFVFPTISSFSLLYHNTEYTLQNFKKYPHIIPGDYYMYQSEEKITYGIEKGETVI